MLDESTEKVENKTRQSKEKDAGFNDKTAIEALKNALDIRKFEIELYWKRAGYFWTFIGLIYAVYCGVLVKLDALTKGVSGINEYQMSILFLISTAGFCLSLSWFYVNKGSKFWQENWENIISMLENYVIGPSYKLILKRDKPKWFKIPERLLMGPQPYSVSKINQLISLYNVAFWLCINYWSIREIESVPCWNIISRISLIAALSFTLYLILGCRSNLKENSIRVELRKPDKYV